MSHGMANAAKKAAMKEKKIAKKRVGKKFRELAKDIREIAVSSNIFEAAQFGEAYGEIKTYAVKTKVNRVIVQSNGRGKYDIFIGEMYIGSYNRDELIVKIKQSWEI